MQPHLLTRSNHSGSCGSQWLDPPSLNSTREPWWCSLQVVILRKRLQERERDFKSPPPFYLSHLTDLGSKGLFKRQEVNGEHRTTAASALGVPQLRDGGRSQVSKCSGVLTEMGCLELCSYAAQALRISTDWRIAFCTTVLKLIIQLSEGTGTSAFLSVCLSWNLEGI